MSKPHNKRRSKKQKGPSIEDNERLWRRITTLFRDDTDWDKQWDSQSIAKLLIEGENLRHRFQMEPKSEKIFRSKLDQTLSEIRKKEQFFINQSQRKITPRRPSEIDEIKRNVHAWQDFFARTTKANGASFGPPILVDDAEEKRYKIVEDSWLAILSGNKLPDELSIVRDSIILTWDNFDLLKEINKYADSITGFRFQESMPSMALLLVMNHRLSAIDILEMRLSKRRQDGRNPFPSVYDDKLVEHCNLLPEVDANKEIANGRVDLRDLPFVTIDPPDAKDFDDAVCITKDPEGTKLWVAIADVANYVHKGTRLDDVAKNRATSVYLPHAVLPMLPPKLADDLCSLRANVDRLAMVVCMILSNDNEIIESKAYEAIIEVKENLAYEDTIDNDKFTDLFTLAKHWQQGEVKLNIHNAEMRPRMMSDESIKVEVKWPNDATKMIETFMVATNSVVGHMLGKHNAPLPWRCHAPPDSTDVIELNAKLSALEVGIELPMPSFKKHGQSEISELSDLLGSWANVEIETDTISEQKTDDVADYLTNVLDPDARQDILDSLILAQKKATTLAPVTRRIVDQGLFQLMQRANYSVENIGHFGLNLDAYVHFTSPIRRYPDLMVHRQLKALLRGEPWAHNEEETGQLADHCSKQATMAKYIEWELVANAYHLHLLRGGEIGTISANQYLDKLEKAWPARIVGLRTPWVFLDLNDDGAIHGRMHLRQMSGKSRLVVDDYGLEVTKSEPEHDGSFKVLAKLGEKYPCKLRGIDIWSGSLDLAPK